MRVSVHKNGSKYYSLNIRGKNTSRSVHRCIRDAWDPDFGLDLLISKVVEHEVEKAVDNLFERLSLPQH